MDFQQDFTKSAEIVVIDDTAANLHLLNGILKVEGYRVRPVCTGIEALASIRAKAPDLILLDILMPGLSGFEVCERLKADEKTRDIPVIFISSMTETEDKLKAFELGGVDYITKPVQQQEVLARVRTHLALARLQRQLQEENERFQRLEEVSFMGLVIHNAGRILEVNLVIQRLFAYTRGQLLGRSL